MNLPLCLMPLWDVDAAVDEIRRNAARGVRAFCFSELPTRLGLPSIHTGHWDPVLAVAQRHRRDALHAHRVVVEQPGGVARRARGCRCARWPSTTRFASMVDWLFSGKLIAVPDAASSRTPRARSAGSRTRSSAPTSCGTSTTPGCTRRSSIPEPPSTYYYGRIFGCFTADHVGLRNLDIVGEDNICFETDYPHTDTTGRTPRSTSRRWSPTSTRTWPTRCCAATPSRCSSSTASEPSRRPIGTLERQSFSLRGAQPHPVNTGCTTTGAGCGGVG